MESSLVEKIVLEVKSQGVFDEFRKDSMADVDTKPAYQNLRQRVENSVKKFLSEQKWTPETNKNQLREKLRRHIAESGFLDVGVERIVDQVVNPKIGSVFQPRIEEIAYKYLGLPMPPKKFDPPPPPMMHPLPPLPITAPPPLKVDTSSLLPHDLEQVSPDSDKGTVKSEIEGDDKTLVDMEMDDKMLDDEEESPPFETLAANESDTKIKSELKLELYESTTRDDFKKLQSLGVAGQMKEDTYSQESNNVTPEKVRKDCSQSIDEQLSQDSQACSVFSDTRHSLANKAELSLLRNCQDEAVAANISEEAQMPKFNENSCDLNSSNEKKEKVSELHFDIKKDEIKFEGTDRKTNITNNETNSPKAIKLSVSAESNSDDNNKSGQFKFVSEKTPDMSRRRNGDATPVIDESSFGSSLENSTSTPVSNANKVSADGNEKNANILQKLQTISKAIVPSPALPVHASNKLQSPPPPPAMQSSTTGPSPLAPTQKSEKGHHSSRHSSSSSSSKYKKHSKDRRRSRDRDHDRDRHRSSSSKDSKHRSSNGKSSSSKHYSSSSNKTSSSSSYHKSSDKNREKSSSSTHSTSKHSRHSSADKKHSSSSSHREHSSSSSTFTKRSDRKDDHNEAKHKPTRRKTTDSNDDSGDKGWSRKTNSSHTKSKSLCSPRSKSTKDNDQTRCSPKSDLPKDHLTNSVQSGDNECRNVNNNNIVILNDLLENPNTQFIELDTQCHLVENVKSLTARKETTASENDAKDVSQQKIEKTDDCIDPTDTCPDLLYFEEKDSQFTHRINLLNVTLDLCRRAVNSLRFDSPIDEGIEVSSDDSNRSAAAKHKADVKIEESQTTPRKRKRSSEECSVKTSPSPSDSSVNSKENEHIDKNTDHVKPLERHKTVSSKKLSQQQRYSSDDLYKPRPVLGQRSKRRCLD